MNHSKKTKVDNTLESNELFQFIGTGMNEF